MSQPNSAVRPVDIEVITNEYRRIELPAGRPVELDMGCGKGGFLIELARRKPDRLIVGVDVMLGRLRKVARWAARSGVTNVRLLRANNRELVEYQLPPRSIRRLHILCPDPWPKVRHRDRRLLNSDFLNRLCRIMEPEGIIHISTDDAAYIDLVKRNIESLAAFENAPLAALADVRDIETEFEQQWKAEGKKVEHLSIRTAVT